MCPLPLHCSNDSQKYEWKIMNKEETQRKKRKEKTLIWKHEIGLGKNFNLKHEVGFLNFLRNLTKMEINY